MYTGVLLTVKCLGSFWGHSVNFRLLINLYLETAGRRAKLNEISDSGLSIQCVQDNLCQLSA